MSGTVALEDDGAALKAVFLACDANAEKSASRFEVREGAVSSAKKARFSYEPPDICRIACQRGL